jgi:hypothetical protein
MLSTGCRKTQSYHNIQLLSLLEEIFRFMDSFDSILFRHVYMEFNMDTYKLSKEGLQLAPGQVDDRRRC